MYLQRQSIYLGTARLKIVYSILAITLFVFRSSDANTQVQSDSMLHEKHTRFLDWKFGMFLHFNMGTFVNREWATGYEDPGEFSPDRLNCKQWAKEARSAGMKYAVLTVKHTGGWCLWDSDYTTHDVTAFYNYKKGKGDIVREYVDAFRKQGLKVGFYYCLPGNFSSGDHITTNGNLADLERGYKITKDQVDLHGLPPEAKGDYLGFIEKQITELLTRYGAIDLFWFDQYRNKYTREHWHRLKELVHRLQPDCIVIANNSYDYSDTDIHSYEYPHWIWYNNIEKALPPEGNNNPGEVSDCIADWWFWNNESPMNFKSAEDIVNLLQLCNERNANYLLNVQPDNKGLISGGHLKLLREVGNLAKKKGVI